MKGPSGIWRRVVLWKQTDVSVVRTASIIRAIAELRHMPEACHLHARRHENLKCQYVLFMMVIYLSIRDKHNETNYDIKFLIHLYVVSMQSIYLFHNYPILT
jgi:hypothetical protein